MTLEQGGMFVAAYEAKFHALLRYSTKLVTTEDERIRLFFKGLNSKLQVWFVHMTSVGKSFNEVTNFVKKGERVRQDGHAKVLAKKPNSLGNFQGSYSIGSGRPNQPIQSARPAFIGNYSGNPPHNLIQEI